MKCYSTIRFTAGFAVGDSSVILKTTNGGIAEVGDNLPSQPKKFELYQNYPNPFNPSTIISYQFSIRSHVLLKVYDDLGRKIAALVNEYQNSGKHSVTFFSKYLPSVIYFYRLKAGNFLQTKKFVLLK